jgi:hypothetical protein
MSSVLSVEFDGGSPGGAWSSGVGGSVSVSFEGGSSGVAPPLDVSLAADVSACSGSSLAWVLGARVATQRWAAAPALASFEPSSKLYSAQAWWAIRRHGSHAGPGCCSWLLIKIRDDNHDKDD